MIWETTCSGFLKQNYVVSDSKGAVATINTGWRTSKIHHRGQEYEARSNGLLSRSCTLSTANKPIIHAKGSGAFSTRFDFVYYGINYQLKRRSAMSSAYNLVGVNGVVGSVDRSGFVRRKIHVDLPVEFPEIIRLFILWLAITTWESEDSAAAV